MSRLFVTERELRLISDLNKELIKDVIGQAITYYPISELKSQPHEVYNEAIRKVYDNPIKIEALVDAKYHEDTTINEFGVDNQYSLNVWIQWRDLVEKGINVSIGDYFSYGGVMYEITERQIIKSIYGMIEHKDGVTLVGTRARQSLFSAPNIGPTDISFTDNDAVDDTFYQQRGLPENEDGETGDVRELVRDGVLDAPLSGPKEVTVKGDGIKGKVSSFYGDED